MARRTRSDLGDRLRQALREPYQRSTEKYERTFFEDTDLDDSPAPEDRGEVLGAGTGRAERAIRKEDLDDIRWDPARAYPQIQTHTSNPERPRTIAAGYDPKNAIVRVTFRNGVTYEYLGVSPRIWSTFQRAPSPGRYINQVLDQYPYRPMIED